jgi:hypothetical protein
MHTVELLDQALGVAKQAGYKIRQEWLGESRGGACVVKGQKWLFLDPTQSPRDQLEEVLEALRDDEAARQIASSGEMQRLLEPRQAA